MIAATLNQALVGLIVAIPSVTLAYFGYRRSQKVDAIAEQAGIATSNVQSIGQVIDGLNGIITNLQADNRVLRDNYSELRKRFDTLDTHYRELRESFDTLETDYKALRARFDKIEKENT